MNRADWAKTLERVLHDTHSSLRKAPDMLEIADQVDSRIEQLVEAGTFTVKLDDESKFHQFELPPSITRWSSASLFRINDAHIVGDQGHVFTGNGEFVRLCPSLRRLDPAKIRRPIPFLAHQKKGAVFHLTGRDHENHGHFLMQHMPRLMAALPFFQRLGSMPAILTAPGHEKWQARYLSALGITSDQVVPCRTGTLHVDELYYVPMLWNEGHLGPPELYRQMQVHFRALAGVNDSAPPKGRPIFITREDAPTRRLSNETEIITTCRNHLGEIDVLSLRNVPLVEQIRRFADAPLVIGPQGQGLTSIIFSRQSRMLILEAGESAGEVGWANAYRDFAHITGNSAIRMLSGEAWPNDGDWTFPVETFASQLQRVVALGLHLHRPQQIR